MSRGKPTAIVFEDEVRQRIKEAQAEALKGIDAEVADAARAMIKELIGVRYDWGRWEFDPFSRVNGNNVQGSAMRAELEAKANELAPALVAKALEKPIEFSAADLTRLRKFLKEATLDATEHTLRARAQQIADEVADEAFGKARGE